MAPPPRPAGGVSRGKWIAAGLAVGVHLAFLLVLVFTVNWQNDRPEAVTAELYAPTSTAAPKAEPAAPEPKPSPPAPPPPVKPPPEPPKKVEPPTPPPTPPPPPKVVPKAVPKVEPKVEPKPAAPSKADLALKEKQEQERKKKEQAERERKDQETKALAKREAEKKQKDEQRVAEVRERQTREVEALKAQAERERMASQRASVDAAKARQDADYKRRIQAKIRGNVNLPPDIAGNPEAIFEVVQLPTGEILDAQLRKSSGVRAYDEALHRAILRSSPLPQPDTPDLFQRNLTLRFRPLD